uniref:Uncharacterized protein n=1 Tax=Salix viminalis TaxID=40686 RepID=A0A6N2M556_SALVM
MKNAEGCIVEIIGEKNLDHFFVGTQDTDMRKKLQEDHIVLFLALIYLKVVSRDVLGMKVYVTDEKELIMEPVLKWAGNPDITIAVKAFGLKATVQDIDMRKKFQEELNPKAPAFLHLGSLSFSLISLSSSKSVNVNSKDCSKIVIALASNDNKPGRLEALKNDYTGIETVEAVEDDEASLEDDVYIQNKQKDTKGKTLQVKAPENARKAPRNFLELLHEKMHDDTPCLKFFASLLRPQWGFFCRHKTSPHDLTLIY